MKTKTKDVPVHRGDWTSPGKARKKAKKDFTTEEIAAGQHGDVEWVDHVGMTKRYGIKRTLGYALWHEGKIHSVSLRHRNRTRGKRLWSCDSIRSYLAQCQSNGDSE